MADRLAALLLFGATGDLARRMLVPSLYGLHADGLLPPDLVLIATARSELDEEGFRSRMATALRDALPAEFYDEQQVESLLKRFRYVAADATEPSGFGRLAQAVGEARERLGIFLSTAPALFEPTIEGLAGAGLTGPGARIALEKPLGTDLGSSRAINDAVARHFPEERTFRVDHYLGKETVQNLLALRFANLLFEPLWNAAHIDHVQISVLEEVGLEGRADYYEGTGALRDMVQNHMLQMLALVAMEPPAAFNAAAVRDEKVKVLRALRPFTASEAHSRSVAGQYGPGTSGGEAAPGYAEELGRNSATETFVALRAHVDNWRWKHVPFFLRTGKRLHARRTEIVIQFKRVPHSIFAGAGASEQPNGLIISLQPEENIRLELMAKTPGLDRGGVRLREVPLDIGLSNAFSEYRRRIAYERLLLDLVEGDSTLFVRRDEIEAQWAWIDSVRRAWEEAGTVPAAYPAGSWGPPAADALIAQDGRRWHEGTEPSR
jgi:glucose-6-phosphate 1-dehydrogenase